MRNGGTQPACGAVVTPAGVRFRVWAPQAKRVRVVIEGANAIELTRQAHGHFEGISDKSSDRAQYAFELDDDDRLLPDPASRYQALGPQGLSTVVDCSRFAWSDAEWPGIRPEGQVLYEMHIGTFTPEGTWRAATEQLAELAALGITVIELMPIVEYFGSFGWSYDGANLFAPSHNYGSPDDLMRFIDEAHRAGIGVILDVVYNHFSPLGHALLTAFSPYYDSKAVSSEWGPTPNFDGEHSGPVRAFILANAAYWIREYHFDGLRVDATQEIHDRSEPHLLKELVTTVRKAAGNRSTYLVAESEPQRAQLLRALNDGGHGFDAAWNDDFHHSAMVRLTGRREAYYTDYDGRANELLAAAKWGYLFQGQRYAWQQKGRGAPALDLPAWKFVNYLQNHDQIANSAHGDRLHKLTSPGRFRAMTALFLLSPQTPLLFQGQEFGASTPFTYFNDCQEDIADSVAEGRAKFLSQFPSLATPEAVAQLPHPCDRRHFERAKLNFSERETHRAIYHLHRDLLHLRKSDVAFQSGAHLDGAVLTDDAFVLRFWREGQTRLAVFNFGPDLCMPSISQPLVAPPENAHWQIRWSSESPDYGGVGIVQVVTDAGWRIPAESATVLSAVSEAD